MAEKIKIGVLGCSSIAERSVIPAILESEFFELYLVASRSPEKGKKFADQFGCDFCTYDELLSSDRVDAVYVSVPTGMHYEWGVKVLKSNKHLLMEKTFVDSYSKAMEIIELARSRNLVAMEALMYLYHPLCERIISIVNAGTIGAVRHIEASFGFPERLEGDIRYDKKLGGGAILDTLVYPLSFCLNFKNTPPESFTYNVIPHEKYDVDARGFLKLDWSDISASINFGFGFVYRNTCTIWGDKGYLTAERVFTRPSDMVGEVRVTKEGKIENIKVQAENHFILMLNDFHWKISGNKATDLNENGDILKRMKIISEMHEHALTCIETEQEKSIEVSVVIPVYYSKDIIKKTVMEIEDAIRSEFSYEFILVNDGSQDGSYDIIKKMAADYPHITALNLMKNFGQHNATMAGLHEASGEYIVVMDDDGQHDPTYIKNLIEKAKEGYDVVYIDYEEKIYGFFKKLGSKINDIMATWLLEKPAKLYLCTYKVFTRNVKNQIIRYPGPYPYIDGTIFTSTKNVTSIPAKHRRTVKAASTYTFRKLIEHWLNMFTNFSIKPLRLIFSFGLLIGFGAFALSIILAFLKIINPEWTPAGWTMITVLILFFGAIQLISLGLVGEYIGRILLFINKRPQFVVKEKADKK